MSLPFNAATPEDLQRLVLWLQARLRSREAFERDIARRSDWFRERLREYEEDLPVAPRPIRRMLDRGLRREATYDETRRLAREHDARIWDRLT